MSRHKRPVDISIPLSDQVDTGSPPLSPFLTRATGSPWHHTVVGRLAGSPKRLWLTATTTGIVFLLLGWFHLWGRDSGPRTDVAQDNLPASTIPTQPDTRPTVQNATISLPDEYYALSADETLCEQYYGLSYIQNLAKKQHAYCEDGSSSTMQCFRTERLQGPFESDTMCVAKGALIKAGQVHMQCALRNFAQEKEQSPAAAKTYSGVQDINQMASYFFGTGSGEEFKSWSFGQTSDAGCTAQSNNGQRVLLAKREGNVNLWHKLMEIWQAMMTMDALRIARDSHTGEPYMTEEEANGVQVVFDDERDEPLDEWWTMVTGKPPVRLTALEPGCYGNAIVPLAGSSSPFWTFLIPQENMREHEFCRMPVLLNAFVGRIFKHLGLEPWHEKDLHADPVVTIIDRKRTRKWRNVATVIDKLKARYPKVKFNLVDFAEISLLDQVRLARETDVLVGHHGAGMTHTLFLPPESAIVEVFPPKLPTQGFRHIARTRGLTHFLSYCITYDEWAVKNEGRPLPEGWTPPASFEGWQEAEWVYMDEDEFLGIVDAAIRSQLHRRQYR